MHRIICYCHTYLGSASAQKPTFAVYAPLSKTTVAILSANAAANQFEMRPAFTFGLGITTKVTFYSNILRGVYGHTKCQNDN